MDVLNQFIVQLKLKANKASMPISFQSYSAVYEKRKINKSLIFVIKRSRMLDEWEANGWWILSRKHFLLTGSTFFLISHFLLYFHTSYSKIPWNTKRKIWLLVSWWENTTGTLGFETLNNNSQMCLFYIGNNLVNL